MAEVTRLMGKMQLDTEEVGVLARVCYEMAVVSDKTVCSFTGEIGVTKAGLRNKEAAGSFSDEEGAVTKSGLRNEEGAVTKSGLRNEEVTSSFTREIGLNKTGLNKEASSSFTRKVGVAKAGLVNKEASSSFTRKVGVAKAGLVNKEATSSFTPEIGVAKFGLGKKEASCSSIGEIGVTKAGLGNKVAAGSLSGEIGVTKAGLNKEAAGTGNLPAGSVKPKEERKAETVVAPVTKERVPDAYIERIKRRPLRKMRPLDDSIAAGKPEIRERFLATNAHIDYLVDLEQDCLRQYKEKGYAEIGVDYSGGFKKVFILPNTVVQVEGK